MCGIVGVLGPETSAVRVTAMAQRLRHRGPDDAGVWCDRGVGLGHTRLSIVDISSAGHQPMLSKSGRYVLSYNGEVYNHLALREELDATDARVAYVGHSDTETLLAGFDRWGVAETLSKAVGMFAIATWDRQEQTLTLARDRLGEKPLYYGRQGTHFLFGSELSALKAHPAFAAEIDRGALALLMRHNYIPAPHSIYRGIRKLVPGTLLTTSPRGDVSLRPYWDPRRTLEHALANPYQGSPDDAVRELETLLRDAVRGQMLSDVPLGAFLSGGIDSSAVVALMQEVSNHPVRTFTIGFLEAAFNEADHAKAVAQHLKTDHTELYVTAAQARDVIPRLPSLYSEPFSDYSQIPTFLVSQLARENVTVAISGDAGDELFAGYSRYTFAERIWGALGPVPHSLRAPVAEFLSRAPAEAWNRWLKPLRPALPGRLAQANLGDKILKGAALLHADTPLAFYQLLMSYWTDPTSVVIGAEESSSVFTDPERLPRTDHIVHQMMATDLLSYLPDDILTKVDRAAMGVSLETRVPMLDHRIVEFAWRLPLEYKRRGGVSKWPLRQVLYKRVPRALLDRPKMGFSVPVGEWLRGPLRDWAESLLGSTRMRDAGYLEPAPVRQMWQEHLNATRNWQDQLWNVLMFQAWLENSHLGPTA